MEIHLSRLYSNDITLQDSASPLSKDFDEIPFFEEAFDTASLRKFFQEHESTNSQSACSPHKENFMLEDLHSQSLDERVSLPSPSSQMLQQVGANVAMSDSRGEFAFNLTMNAKFSNMSPAIQANLSQAGPFTINKLPHKITKQLSAPTAIDANNLSVHKENMKRSERKKSTNTQLPPLEVPCLMPRVMQHAKQEKVKTQKKKGRKEKESKFEMLLRTKKIFTIHKEPRLTQPHEETVNGKRQTTSPLDEEFAPVLKQSKSNFNPGQQGIRPNVPPINFIGFLGQNNNLYPVFSNQFQINMMGMNNPYAAQMNKGEGGMEMRNLYYNPQNH